MRERAARKFLPGQAVDEFLLPDEEADRSRGHRDVYDDDSEDDSAVAAPSIRRPSPEEEVKQSAYLRTKLERFNEIADMPPPPPPPSQESATGSKSKARAKPKVTAPQATTHPANDSRPPLPRQRHTQQRPTQRDKRPLEAFDAQEKATQRQTQRPQSRNEEETRNAEEARIEEEARDEEEAWHVVDGQGDVGNDVSLHASFLHGERLEEKLKREAERAIDEQD